MDLQSKGVIEKPLCKEEENITPNDGNPAPSLQNPETITTNLPMSPELPHYITKNSYSNDRGLICILVMNIINVIIISIFLVIEFISENGDFPELLFVYIDRIIMIVLALTFLFTYKISSKLIRKLKTATLIISLIAGLTLRIIQMTKDPKCDGNIIEFRLIFSLVQINQ